MATSLSSIVNTKFLSALANVGANASTAVQSSQSQQDSVRVALSTGTNTFVTAVRAINTAGAFVNLAKAGLEQLDKLTDKMIDIATKAAKPGAGQSARAELNAQFFEIASEFQEIVEKAEINGENYLTKGGLAGLFRTFGLDPDTSTSIDALFDKFKTVEGDTTGGLASEVVKGTRPIRIPDDAFTIPTELSRSTKEYDGLFDENRKITNRPDGYRLLHDLKALKEQISQNQGTLDLSIEVLQKNLDLARSAGLAFLQLSQEQVTDPKTADEVAQSLREAIRKNAPQALSQAENLQPMAVAALLLSNTGFGRT